MKKFLAVAAVAAFAQFGFAEGEPEGEVLGEFLYQTRTGVVVTVEVAAGAVRTLAAMPYGRGSGSKIVKTGPGKLIIKDLRNYPGQVIVEAGAIRIGDIDEDAGESEVCDIQNLSLANGTEVEVAEGKTARIAGIDFSTRFTKSGGGTLEIVNTANKRLVNVKLTGGAIVYVNEPTVSSLAQLAAGPSLHLDANDTEKMEFASATSKTVNKWYDAKGVNYAGKAAGSPTLVVGATTNQTTGAELNAVSFGDFRSTSRSTLSDALHGVRIAFVVAARGKNGGKIGMLLGTAPGWCLDSATSPDAEKDIADFKYGTDNSGWPLIAFEADTSKNYTVRNSATCGTTTFYYDGAEDGTTSGETTDPKKVPAPTSTQNFILHEIRLPVGAHVSSLAGWGANSLHSGGWRYGEVILYERELTVRERIATRNYLAQKWLGKTDAELTPLPDAPADPDPFVLPEYEAEDGGTLAVAAGETFRTGLFTGKGTFTKEGEGTLAVKDFVGYEGALTVAGGTLKLTGERPAYEPIDPATLDPALHFDASAAGSFTYIDESKRTFSAWASKNGAGVSAKRKLNCLDAGAAMSVKTSEALGGKDYVNFPSYTGAHFRDDTTGVTNTYCVRTMITLVGSQNGGGMLLGGTDSSDPFFRGPNGYGGSASDPILWGGTGSTEPTRHGEFYLNFERLANSMSAYGNTDVRDPTEVGLSGGWDVVGFRASGSDLSTHKPMCQGLAFESIPSHYRDGKQNLAEVAIWTNVLSAADVQGMGAYLKLKWNQAPTWQRSRVNGLDLHVAEGATLDLGGETQYLASLGGAGTITNGTLCLGTITLDPLAGPIALSVPLDLSATKTIAVSNVLLAVVGTPMTLLTAESIVGTLDGIALAGLDDLPTTLDVLVEIRENALVLTVVQKAYVKTLSPADGSSVPVAAAFTTAVDYVVGEGTFTKTGAGTLAAKDVVGYTGTVAVAEGTLTLTGERPPYEPAMPSSENCVMHLDASDLESLTLVEQGGKTYVSEWRSQTPNGWRVTPTAGTVTSYPIFAADSGLADNAGSVRIQNSTGMWFKDADGNKVMTTNVLSALWILGSQSGGGFLLGLSQTWNGRKSHFFRGAHGGDYGSNPNDYIFDIGACDGVRTMEVYLNDKRLCASANFPGGITTDTPMNTGLSGGWDYLSGRTWENSYRNKVAADSLAYDPATSSRSGHQRLAELLVFERILTSKEERAASAYLRVKWGLEPTWQRSRVNAFGVNVAADATLDLDGGTRYVGTLGGMGSVANGTVLAGEFVLDALAGKSLDLTATLDLSETERIEVGNVAAMPIGTKTLLAATEVKGTLDGIEIVGLTDGMPPTRSATLTLEDNALVLTVIQMPWLKTLAPADDSSVLVPEGETTLVDFVVGAGAFTKIGAGALGLKDLVGYTGAVTVAEGTLKLTGVLPPVEPAMPDSTDLVLHLDAADLSTFVTTNVGGRALIKSWRSKTPNGWKAVPRLSTYPSNRARLEADETLGGAPTVRIPDNGSRGMAFYDADGNRVGSTNVLSALWILGSQEGGGFLLGQERNNGVKASDGWHRGESGWGGRSSDYLFYSGAFDGVKLAEMYVNDLRLSDYDPWPKGKSDHKPGNTGLSGGWDFISMRVPEYFRNQVAADGLAFHTNDSYGRSGKQRLAEVLIYERQLTEAEAFKAGAYLRVKWGLEPTWQRSQTNGFGIDVAKNATLDLGGTNQFLAAIGGAGTVVNGDLTAKGLVASADGALTVSGSFTATDDFTVDLRQLPAGLDGEITILTTAGGIVNGTAIRRATVVSDDYPEARAHVRSGTVFVRLKPLGALLIVR